MDGPLEYYPCLSILANSITNLTSQQEQKEDWGHIIKSLALKKWIFTHKKYFPIFFFYFSLPFILCNSSVWTLQYFHKYFKFFFLPTKTKKNRPQKLLIIDPNHFFYCPAQNSFFILWICPKTHLSPYLCLTLHSNNNNKKLQLQILHYII